MKELKPSLEEFENFSEYIADIAKNWKNTGLLKLIPPQQWIYDTKNMINNDFKQLKFDKIIQQSFTNINNANKKLFTVTSKDPTLAQPWDFEDKEIIDDNIFDSKFVTNQLNNSFLSTEKQEGIMSVVTEDKNSIIDDFSGNLWNEYYTADVKTQSKDLENEYWDSIKASKDIILHVKDQTNEINSLANLLKLSKIYHPNENDENEAKSIISDELISNVFRASNPWKIKKLNNVEIYFLHSGSPRIWYSIDNKTKDKFQKLIENHINNEATDTEKCAEGSDIFDANDLMISPDFLKASEIKYDSVLQKENEFIILLASNCYSSIDLNSNLMERLTFQIASQSPSENVDDDLMKNSNISKGVTNAEASSTSNLLDLEGVKLANNCLFELENIKNPPTNANSKTYFNKEQYLNNSIIGSQNLTEDLNEPSSYLKTLNYGINDVPIHSNTFTAKPSNNFDVGNVNVSNTEDKDITIDENFNKILVGLPEESSSLTIPPMTGQLEYSNHYVRTNLTKIDGNINNNIIQQPPFVNLPNTTIIPTTISPTVFPSSTFYLAADNGNFSEKHFAPLPTTTSNNISNNYIYTGGSLIGAQGGNYDMNTGPVLPRIIGTTNALYNRELSSLELVRTDDLIHKERIEKTEQFDDIKNVFLGGLSGTHTITKSTADEIIKTKNGKLFKCSICKRMFSSGHHLTRHKKCVHSNLKPYPCPKCAKRFKRKDHVMQHLQKKQTCKPL